MALNSILRYLQHFLFSKKTLSGEALWQTKPYVIRIRKKLLQGAFVKHCCRLQISYLQYSVVTV